MNASEAQLVERVVDTSRYPLSEPTSAAWRDVVSQTHHDLHELGCSVLPGFVRSSLCEELRREGEEIAPLAHDDVETVNVYNIAADPSLPEDHPGRIPMQRGNAFVPRDRIPENAIIHQLYTSPLFQRFLASCFDLPRVHELGDPLAGLCLNVVSPGMEHPWHFDTNEFAVSMLTQESEGGGVFEYCPDIRSAHDENVDDVRAVLTGGGGHLIRRRRCARVISSCSKAASRCTGSLPWKAEQPATPPSSPTASARVSWAACRARSRSSAGCCPSTWRPRAAR